MQYNEKMAAQIAALFTYLHGGSIEILKLMKLMYLAERQSLQTYGEPMMGDRLVSMNKGPNMSYSYDKCKNKIVSENWKEWLNDRKGNWLSLIDNKDPHDNLTELSEADLEVLQDVWDKFGAMSAGQLIDYTHKHCPEWKHPEGSSNDIPYSEVLSALGYTGSVISELENRITEQKNIDKNFSTSV